MQNSRTGWQWRDTWMICTICTLHCPMNKRGVCNMCNIQGDFYPVYNHVRTAWDMQQCAAKDIWMVYTLQTVLFYVQCMQLFEMGNSMLITTHKTLWHVISKVQSKICSIVQFQTETLLPSVGRSEFRTSVASRFASLFNIPLKSNA